MIKLRETCAQDLASCLHSVALAVPALTGRIISDNTSEIGSIDDIACRLLDYWRSQHPEAGACYWVSRSWGMLIWQPAYLSVLCVHLSGVLPTLDNIQQEYAAGSLAGFTLPSHVPLHADENTLIDEAGLQLQRLWRNWHAAFSRQNPYSYKQASCLLADCLLSALLLLPAIHPSWCVARLNQYAGLWLAASGLSKRSGLLWVQNLNGRQSIDLHRQTCCQHFRRSDGEPCNTCPRRSLAQRKMLLLQNPACVI